jgi:acetyl-CoA acetyltransferase
MNGPSRRAGYEDIAVAVPVTIPYQRYSIRGAHWWLARALADLLAGAGLAKQDVDGACVSSFLLFPDTAVGLMQHLGLSPRWLDHVPMGGASAVVALRRAARAVQSGDASIVACLAGDTNHVDSFRYTVASFSQFARDAVYPYGSGGPNASFAFLTDYYMRSFGARREDFGKLCVAQRANAASFPHALLRKPLTMADYLDARPIADPLRLFDCVMPCAGAEAFLVMSADRARQLGLPYARVLATIERHNAFPDDPIQMRGGWALDRDELYAQAAVGPADVDFLQAYDDYPVITLMQIEDLGFCEKGAGAAFVRQHEFTAEGSFPLNTSGGQLSVGQAGAAGGYLGLVEALRQLTGRPLGRPVPRARIGLVSGFGMINYDRGLCSGAALLAGSGA